jgi:predicted ATPase with chaperone activity
MKYLFRGGTVVSGRGTRRADVLVEDEKILRVARTVADLAGKQLLDEEALLEALQYRAQEKVETF